MIQLYPCAGFFLLIVVASGGARPATPAQSPFGGGRSRAALAESAPVVALADCNHEEILGAVGNEILVLDKSQPLVLPMRFASYAEMEKICALKWSRADGGLAVGGGVAGKSGTVLLDYSHLSEPPVKLKKLAGGEFTDLVTSLAFNEDGTLLIAGSSDGTARVLVTKDLSTKFELKGHTGPVLGCDARGDRIATGSYDRTIRIWNLKSGALERVFTNHGGPVNAVAFDAATGRLISASDDHTIREWDPETGRMVRIYREHEGRVLCFIFEKNMKDAPPAAAANINIPVAENHKNRTILTGSSDGVIRRIDLDAGTVKNLKTVAPGAWIDSIISRKAGSVVVGTDRGAAVLDL